jgi:hypothetical protein
MSAKLFGKLALWITISLVSLLFEQGLHSQPGTLFPDSNRVLTRQIPISNVLDLYISQTQQIYVITELFDVLRIDTSGHILQRYNNRYLGQPSFLYFENPLQLALFYTDFQIIIILDQWMNELSRINLATFSPQFLPAIGLAQDRSIWYFDEPLRRLKRINSNGKLIFESTLINEIENKSILRISLNQSQLIIEKKDSTCLILDAFGRMRFNWPSIGKVVYQNPGNLLIRQGRYFTRANIKEGVFRRVETPLEEILTDAAIMSFWKDQVIFLAPDKKLALIKQMSDF